MNITDPAHAKRVLEALVEQGEKIIQKASDGPWICDQKFRPVITGFRDYEVADSNSWEDVPLIASSRSLVPALVEGAKKALARLQNAVNVEFSVSRDDDCEDHEKELWLIVLQESKEWVVDLAQAYAPRMKECGMEVPE